MSKQDPNSRFQKYDFNVENSNKRRNSNKNAIWPWIIILIIIVLILAFGIRFIIKINSHSIHSNSIRTSTVQKNKSNVKNNKSNNTKNSTSNNSKNNSYRSTSSANKATTTKKDDNNTNNQNDGSSEFDQPHTFNSVNDAKSWAQATQDQWLASGYNTYTITQNGQGFYILTFVK